MIDTTDNKNKICEKTFTEKMYDSIVKFFNLLFKSFKNKQSISTPEEQYNFYLNNKEE